MKINCRAVLDVVFGEIRKPLLYSYNFLLMSLELLLIGLELLLVLAELYLLLCGLLLRSRNRFLIGRYILFIGLDSFACRNQSSLDSFGSSLVFVGETKLSGNYPVLVISNSNDVNLKPRDQIDDSRVLL